MNDFFHKILFLFIREVFIKGELHPFIFNKFIKITMIIFIKDKYHKIFLNLLIGHEYDNYPCWKLSLSFYNKIRLKDG